MHGRLTAGREAVFRVPIVAVPCSSAQPGPKRGATAKHAEHAHTRSKLKRSAKHLFSSRIYEVRARVSPQFGCEETLYIEQKHLLQKKVSTPPRGCILNPDGARGAYEPGGPRPPRMLDIFAVAEAEAAMAAAAVGRGG